MCVRCKLLLAICKLNENDGKDFCRHLVLQVKDGQTE